MKQLRPTNCTIQLDFHLLYSEGIQNIWNSDFQNHLK